MFITDVIFCFEHLIEIILSHVVSHREGFKLSTASTDTVLCSRVAVKNNLQNTL